MSLFNKKSSSSTTTNNTTNINKTIGANTGAQFDSIFGNKQFSFGSSSISNEANGGGFSVGGVDSASENRSENINTTTQSQKDEVGISAAVGVGGGSAGSGSVGVGGNDSLGSNAMSSASGSSTSSGINPLMILGAGALGLIALAVIKKKKG